MADLSGRWRRAQAANGLLALIASRGRKFFAHRDRVGRFDVDDRGRVWFTDAYTQARIYTHSKGSWRGFTNGGTLRALIEALRDFIRTGAHMRGHLGPWSPNYCDGDLWGYGFDDMQEIRDLAERLGIATPQAAEGEGNEN